MILDGKYIKIPRKKKKLILNKLYEYGYLKWNKYANLMAGFEDIIKPKYEFIYMRSYKYDDFDDYTRCNLLHGYSDYDDLIKYNSELTELNYNMLFLEDKLNRILKEKMILNGKYIEINENNGIYIIKSLYKMGYRWKDKSYNLNYVLYEYSFYKHITSYLDFEKPNVFTFNKYIPINTTYFNINILWREDKLKRILKSK